MSDGFDTEREGFWTDRTSMQAGLSRFDGSRLLE